MGNGAFAIFAVPIGSGILFSDRITPQKTFWENSGMIITFCGHRNVFLSPEEEQTLQKILLDILSSSPDAVFYLGGYGRFDEICDHALKTLQKDYPLLKRIFVTPYLEPSYCRQREAEGYDDILYPFVEKVPPRLAILKRNQWMIDRSDVVVAYVTHPFGGANETLAYAKKRKKRIIFVINNEKNTPRF